ncbi:MAG: tandem-95 repeat protein [Xanthomonadales bacterium]|nr:tandem-95 repeat protein [Xanthomonadales bacterium]
MSRSKRVGRIALALIFLNSITLSPTLWAGAYIFAGDGNGVDVITHPKDYFGDGGVLNVGVCIDPASFNISELVIPVQNNIAVWNDLQPVESNVEYGAVSGLDVESVLLHELGHCIGLAHVNAASESGLPGDDSNYTKATVGANGAFDIDPGPDGVRGSHDDIRGDDVNLHWFNPANDPFQLPIHTPVDTTQYQREPAFLPGNDTFAQNASRQLRSYLGLSPAEAVMQQMTYYDEIQRELVSDDAATVLLAASGLDETSGTSDDYQVVLTYEGVTTGSNCDITVAIEDTTSFAYCSTGGSFVGNGHVRITSASVHLGKDYNWVFNTVPRGGDNQPPVANTDTGAVDEDGATDIAVLINDSDPDNDPLDVTGVTNPPNGSTTINPDSTVGYTPDSNYNGTDSFSYTVSDGNGGSDTGSVSVTVNPVNDYPVAADDSGIVTSQDTPVDIYVLDNDSDVDNDPLNVAAVNQGMIGTVANNNGYVTYQPSPGATGSDSFAYTVSDGNGGSDSATVSVTVTAPNQAPTAYFTATCTGQTCDFDASGSSDPDGTITGYDWDFGDGANANGAAPSHYYAAPGQYTVTLTVTDDQAATGNYAELVTATADPADPDYAVADYNAVQGTLSGSYLDTRSPGGGVQSIVETHTGGKPSRRADSLEHIWQFNLTGGNHKFNVAAQPTFPGGDADDAFTFQWSTSPNGGWQTMLTVPGGSTMFDVGEGVSGTVYVRVVDNNSDPGNTVYSTIAVDHMYFDGGAPPTDPPASAANPSPANGATGVPVSATLSWNAGSGAELHDVYFGTVSGSLSLVSEDQVGTSYEPGALSTATTYYWRIDEQNGVGTTAGTEWSFTTSSSTGPTELEVASIVLGTANAGKGRKHGQAVVSVIDNLGNAVTGAAVTGTFSGSFNQTVSNETGGDGAATLTTSESPQKRDISYTFCVDTITGVAGLTYDPSTPDCQNY